MQFVATVVLYVLRLIFCSFSFSFHLISFPINLSSWKDWRQKNGKVKVTITQIHDHVEIS